jgi:hypothetical protein
MMDDDFTASRSTHARGVRNRLFVQQVGALICSRYASYVCACKWPRDSMPACRVPCLQLPRTSGPRAWVVCMGYVQNVVEGFRVDCECAAWVLRMET